MSGVRASDRIHAMAIHAGARRTVRYGANLRFAGADLPAPARIKVATRHGRVPVHVYRAGAEGPSAPMPVHVHFHGGAWLMRYPEMDDWWCRYLAVTAGVVVLNVDFRTGPYVTYPVAQEQCHDVVAHIAAGRDRGIDPERISVGGFSSGGGLAASVCLQARDAGTARPVLQVLGVPALDLASALPPGDAMISRSFRELVRRVYFPDPATRSEAYASPLLADDLSGLPPAVVCTAERDALRPDGDRYVERLRAAGVAVVHDVTPGVDHYFLTADPVRARRTMAMIAAAIARATGSAARADRDT